MRLTEEQELREIKALGLATSEAAYGDLVRRIRAGMTAEEWASIEGAGRRSYGVASARTPAPACITGAEADIEANYPCGLAAFRRGEPADRTPHHKGEVAGY
jgi:hypothetical protein